MEPGSPTQSLKERQQAGQDMADIKALEQYAPFQRYWMRRIHQMQADFLHQFINGEMSHEARENVRQKMLLLQELIGMGKTDLKMAAKYAETPTPNELQRPVQHG